MTHERVEAARQPKVRNDDIARAFAEVADILELEEDNPFRILAYRNAARTLRDLGEEVADLISRGGDPDDLPGIGKDLAAQIREMISSGRLSKLDRLRRAGRLQEQGDAIDRFNAENPGFTVLKGVEVDILPDGQLDLPDDALRRLILSWRPFTPISHCRAKNRPNASCGRWTTNMSPFSHILPGGCCLNATAMTSTWDAFFGRRGPEDVFWKSTPSQLVSISPTGIAGWPGSKGLS